MRLILFVFIILLAFPTPTAESGDGIIHRQGFPTTFVTLNVVDENNQFVGKPVLVHIKSFNDGVLVDDYSITLIKPNQNITVPWTVDYRESGTEITLIASKDGYKNSEPFVFVITEDTPTDGLLFEHTFILTKLSSPEIIKINEITESIIFHDNSFDIQLTTTSNIQKFTFDPEIASMIITLDEPNSNGFLNVTFQAIFMDGPFRIVVDDFLGTFIDYENNGFHTIQIEYLLGSHEIIIKSKTIFQPEIIAPALSIQLSNSEINSNEQLVVSGTLLPIQPQAFVNLEISDPQGEIIFRNIPVLSDGSFEYIFNPYQEGEWIVVGRYDFNGAIIESRKIIFTVIESPDAPSAAPAPEPAPEPEEAEPKAEESKEPESKPIEEKPEEKSETSLTSYIVPALVLLMIVGGGIYFYMNRKDTNTKSSPQEPKVEDGEPVLEPTPGSIEEPNKDNGNKKLFDFKPKIKERFRNLNYKIFIGFLLILLMLPLGYGYYQVQDDLSQIEIECNGFSDFDLKVKTVSAVMHNTVKNPTEREISIDLIQYQVFSNNTQVANGTITDLVIPANTTTTLKSDIEIESGFLLNLFLEELIGAFDSPELTAELTLHQSGQDKNIHAMPLLDSKSGEIKNANLVYIEFSSGIFFKDLRIINYSYPDPIDGKIALIERDPGETNFFWKYSSLKNEGVKGVIIYNNEPGLFDAQIANFGRWNLTMVTISQKDGQMLLENIENNKVSLNVKEEQNQKDELPLIIKGTITKKFGFIDLKTPFEIPNQCNFNPN